MASPASGYFGKLPWHGDFLREAPPGAPLDLIDAWLAHAPIGPAGPRSAAFDAAGPALAMVRARGHWWAMALFPSQDAVGRRFPFVALAGLPEGEFGDEAGLVAVAWAPFLVRCLQQAARGWPGDPAGLRAAVAACVQPIDTEAEGRHLVEALADRTVGELWAGTLGSAADPRRAGMWMDIVGLAGDPARAIGLELRPMAHQAYLAFVLMLMHLVGDPAGAPVLLAIRPARPGGAAGATVLWGRPGAAECLAALWPELPGADRTRIHDPASRPGAHGDPARAPVDLDDAGLSLRDLLHRIGSATRRHVRRR